MLLRRGLRPVSTGGFFDQPVLGRSVTFLEPSVGFTQEGFMGFVVFYRVLAQKIDARNRKRPPARPCFRLAPRPIPRFVWFGGIVGHTDLKLLSLNPIRTLNHRNPGTYVSLPPGRGFARVLTWCSGCDIRSLTQDVGSAGGWRVIPCDSRGRRDLGWICLGVFKRWDGGMSGEGLYALESRLIS